MPANTWPGIAAVLLLAVTVWGLVSTPGVTLPEPDPPCTVEELAGTVAATPAPTGQSVVTSLLTVDAAAGVPRLNGQLIVSTNADRTEVDRLRSFTPGRSEYFEKIKRLLSFAGVGPFNDDQAAVIGDALAHPPTISIVDRLVTLVFHTPDNEPVFGYGGRQASYWTVDSAGVDLLFRTRGMVPAGSTWRGGICLDDMHIVSEGVPPQARTFDNLRRPSPTPVATPAFTVNNGNRSYFWTHSVEADATSAETTVQVRARPDVTTMARLALFTGNGWFVAGAWYFLILLALPVAAIWFVRPRLTRGTATGELVTAITRQRTAALVLIQFLSVGFLATAVAVMRAGGLPGGGVDPNAVPFGGYVVLAVLGLGVAVLWYFNGGAEPRTRWLSRRVLIIALIWVAIWLIWVDSAWPARWATIGRVLLALGFGQFAAAGVRLRVERGGTTEGRWLMLTVYLNILLGVTLATLAEASLAVAAIVPVWTIGSFAFGMVQLLVALMPPGSSASGPAPRMQPAIAVVAIGFGIATLVQWVWWTTFNLVPLPKREALLEDPGAGFAPFAASMQTNAATFAEVFLATIPDLLSFVLLVAVVGVLAAGANSAAWSLVGDDRRWLRGLVIFLFATFVVGYGGAVLGYRFPLAWMSVFVLAPVTLRTVPLTGVGPAPPAADGGETPTLAPAMSWWDNGRQAAKIGAVLATLPVGYFLFVLGSVGGARLVSRDANFGAVTLVSSVASEYAFWVVAAFTFGCLYSSLVGAVGPVRGFVLAGVFAGARGIELLVLGGDGVIWLVRSFELALFLAVIGAWLDAQNLHRAGTDWRSLLTSYQVDNLRVTVGYFYPIVVALIGVIKLLQGEQVEKAVNALVTEVIMALPAVPTG